MPKGYDKINSTHLVAEDMIVGSISGALLQSTSVCPCQGFICGTFLANNICFCWPEVLLKHLKVEIRIYDCLEIVIEIQRKK